ncbi:hypothetical protein Tco_1130809 [Tanacetum coccineum]
MDSYLGSKLKESVDVAVQLKSDRIREEAQVENEDFFNKIDDNVKKIIKEQVNAKIKKKVKKILPRIEKLVNEQLDSEVLIRSSNKAKTSHAVAANLSELELKKILIDKIKNNKSVNRSDVQKNLYKALVDAYEANKDLLDTYGDTVTIKRRRDDADDDQEPSARLDRGSKRRRAGKEPESTSAPKGKTSKTTKPMHNVHDFEEPTHQEFETGVTDDQPIEETYPLPNWFQQPTRPPTPDHDWNKTLPADHGPVQPWLSNLARQEDPRESFDELMDTPLDFLAFMMNRLKVDTLTPELLAGPTFKLMKGTCKSLVELEYFFEEIIVISNGLKSWESARDVYSRRRIIAVIKLQIVEWHGYKHLDWITVRRDDDKLHIFKEGDYKRLRLQDIKDMLLLFLQGKLTNLNVEEHLPKEAQHHQAGYPKGFIYQNRDKKNKLMRVDELHKFSDGTLNDVRTALDDRLKGIRMEYLTQTIWRKSNRERVAARIQAIDK